MQPIVMQKISRSRGMHCIDPHYGYKPRFTSLRDGNPLIDKVTHTLDMKSIGRDRFYASVLHDSRPEQSNRVVRSALFGLVEA